MAQPPVRIVQLTPPGRGAIATLLVEGPGAADLIDSQFRPHSGRPLSCHPLDQLVVGRIGPPPGEEIVVRRRRPDSLELHCHGGHAALASIIAGIEATPGHSGCRTISWQDWLPDQYDDPIAAAAHAALAAARTERTAAILLDQYHGALRRAWRQIEQRLHKRYTSRAGKQIDALLARAELGRHLTTPWQVVLAGNPNVGKSSLINALVGYPRAIVHHAPGTTRDVLSACTAIDGWPVELSDTAGLGPHDGPIEQAGAQLAAQRLCQADLVVLVFDASTAWSQADSELVEAWPQALVVHNKSDLPADARPRPPGLATSALTGQGIEALAQAIANRLVPDPPPPGAAVPFSPEQLQQLEQLRAGSR